MRSWVKRQSECFRSTSNDTVFLSRNCDNLNMCHEDFATVGPMSIHGVGGSRPSQPEKTQEST